MSQYKGEGTNPAGKRFEEAAPRARLPQASRRPWSITTRERRIRRPRGRRCALSSRGQGDYDAFNMLTSRSCRQTVDSPTQRI